jgi:hypothetical protein
MRKLFQKPDRTITSGLPTNRELKTFCVSGIGADSIYFGKFMRRIRSWAGMVPNKFLAKIASDWKKPVSAFIRTHQFVSL